MSFKVIAIDGPAGSGKSTISRLVANKIGYVYVKTGEMFRSITYAIIKANIDYTDVEAVKSLIQDIRLEFKFSEEKQFTILNGEDITAYLNSKEVSSIVSQVSSIKEVRDLVLVYEKEAAKYNNVVMEGRDIGTVVFPNADIKIFLNSSIETRAKRRYEQAMQERKDVTYQEILDNIKKRDELDKTKKYGALQVPTDAIIVNSDNLEIEQTVQKILDIICGEI